MAVAQLSPRSETLAYRIWAIANPRGWDLTLRELADELGETMERVRNTCLLKRWTGRLRVATRDCDGSFASRRAHAGCAYLADFGVGEIA